MDLAKIEAGRWQLHEAEMSLFAVAGDALQQVTWRAQNGGIALENVIDPRLDTVFADERSIKQILLNLLSNAVKFTPEGGTVKVFAQRLPDGEMVVGVSDSGVGIADKDWWPRCSTVSARANTTSPLPTRALGLGHHTIVKGLVEAHGGTVRLESKVGVGTTVTLRLPASRVIARKAPQAA